MKTQYIAVAVAFAISLFAGADEMFPFVPSYDAPDNVVNMSHILEAPAGRHGRIRVKDGHFVNDKGRDRFNATNLTGPANFPPRSDERKEEVPVEADADSLATIRIDPKYKTVWYEVAAN